MGSKNGSSDPLVDQARRIESGELDREDLFHQLRTERYPDAPDRRIEAIVDGALDRVAARREVPLTTQPRTTEEKKAPPGPTRRLEADDVAELSDREFGRLFGLALRQFCDDVDVETGSLREGVTTVNWSGANGEVLAVVVTRQNGSQLSERQVEEISELVAMWASDDQRTALVTNAEVSSDAAAYATEYGTTVCDRRHLDGILSLARVPPEAYGEALESGEATTFDWDTLTENLPAPPVPLGGVDPLDAPAVRERSALWATDSNRSTDEGEAPDDTETSTDVSWQSSGPSESKGAGSDATTPEVPADGSTSASGWEVDESDTVTVDEERLGELHAEDSSDTDEAVDGLIENLEESS